MQSRLTEDTLWRINFNFMKEGASKSTNAAIRVRMIEARGYEPPQGRLFVGKSMKIQHYYNII